MRELAYNQLEQFITNPVLLSALLSWISAQFIKTVIKLFTGRVKNIRELFELLLWRTGGMPSSHSALVAAITTAIGFNSGIGSDVFVLSLCFSLVVVRDAVGVRRSSGLQARAINEMGERLTEKLHIRFKSVKEIQGHRPMEVIVGCLLGIFISTAFSTL